MFSIPKCQVEIQIPYKEILSMTSCHILKQSDIGGYLKRIITKLTIFVSSRKLADHGLKNTIKFDEIIVSMFASFS